MPGQLLRRFAAADALPACTSIFVPHHPATMGIAKKAAATALTTATSLAWRRLSWQARAAWVGGSLALGAFRRLAGIRKALGGGGGREARERGRRRLNSGAAAGPVGMPPGAAALLA